MTDNLSDDDLRATLAVYAAEVKTEDYEHLPDHERKKFKTLHHMFTRLHELLPPADGKQPVTAEWLKAVGFLNEDDDEPTFWTVTFDDLNPAFTIDVDPSSTRHAGWIGEAEDYTPWPHDICDRQQVRDICRALGVTLQEPHQ